MKTSELTGAALDWAVAKAKGYADFVLDAKRFREMHDTGHYNYSTDWAQGGPIIDREKIGVDYFDVGNGRPVWVAGLAPKQETGPTPLIAAMRCYVASKLGDEVEVPEELLA